MTGWEIDFLTISCPDITFLVNVVRQFMSSPIIHWGMPVCFKYLRKFLTEDVICNDRGLGSEASTEADWAGSSSDKIFILRSCAFVGRNLVSW